MCSLSVRQNIDLGWVSFVGMVTKNLDESRHFRIEQGYEKVLFQKLNRFFLPGLRPKLII